ncbi:MAG: type II secretion system F family protein [Propioniciclava sp.]|uniref:type II secretion system F family protein n=1 Tax=Propioniciclava sp. TaxID=2038686 RepID=UPI0039E2D3EA
MTMLIAVVSGMTLVAGVLGLVAWWRGAASAAETPQSSPALWTKIVENLRRVRGRTAVMMTGAAVVGVVLALWTRWPVMVVVAPAAVLGIPRLLAAPRQTDIELLGALDRWVRGMASTLSTGKSIADALRLSARTPPPLLAEPLVLLIRRLDDRWTPEQALTAMADELGSPDADAVLASLILAINRGGTGAAATLSALADTIQGRLSALREIEAERAKPRVVVQQVTIITLVVLGAALLFARDFFAPLATPIGQIILVVLIVAYVGSLVMLRRMTLPRRRARILRGTS